MTSPFEDINDVDFIEPKTETIADRVARGYETQSNADGAIVPFLPLPPGRGFFDMLDRKTKATFDRMSSGGFCSTFYNYKDEQGRVIQKVVRFDHPTLKKQIKPLIHCGNRNFWFHSIDGQRPLYNLDQVAARPDAPILVVEGEKAAESASVLFPEYVVTTWMSGATSVHRTEMLPLFGRSITIWPDNDKAGKKAADKFAYLALTAGAASAKIVRVPEVYPEKWDLADIPPENLPDEQQPAQLLQIAAEVSIEELGASNFDAKQRAAKTRLLGLKPGHSNVSIEEVVRSLAELDPDMCKLDWLAVGRSLFLAFGNSGLDPFKEWSSQGDKYKKGEPESLWENFKKEPVFTAKPLFQLFRLARRVSKEKGTGFELDADANALAAIEWLNADHAVVTRGGKTVVMWERYDPVTERYRSVYLAKEEFCRKIVRKIELPESEATKSTKRKPLGEFWFQSAWRRQYESVIFAPGLKLGPAELNLWTGFTVEPTDDPDGWSLFKRHLFENVASGDQESYDYILNWFAFGVQKLRDPVGTALILVGPKGAGKSVVTGIYGKLFGMHTYITSHQNDITGRFNAHLETTMLLGVEEAFAPQDRSADGILKDLITRRELRIEDKFFAVWSAKNHLKIIMTSNSDHVVRADLQERRYAVFDVENPFGDDPEGRHAYFAAIFNQMETGGYSAMLGELLKRDIENWNPEKIPETKALKAQKTANLVNDPVTAWYHDRLTDGLDIVSGNWQHDASRYPWSDNDTTFVPVSAVAAEIAAFAKARGLNISQNKIKEKLSRFLPEGFQAVTKRRSALFDGSETYKAYPFPPIRKARQLFTDKTKIEFDRDIEEV